MELDRNNTSYPSLISEYINNIKPDPNGILFDYQNIVFNYLQNPLNRGLLIFHSTGSGKSITGISISEHFRKLNRDIVILSTKSLKSNYIKEIENYSKKMNSDITDDEVGDIVKDYKFVTMNASNMIKQLQKKDSLMDEMLYEINKFNLDNKVIIIDEAHNLFNSIVNGSRNANEFYELVMKSKNIKIIFLTGSPIINNFFEIVPALNMCAGYKVLPEYYRDFKNMYIDEKSNSIKNKIKLQSRILGLVSYHGTLFTEKYKSFVKSLTNKSNDRENFPTKLPITIEQVPMSKIQNMEYIRLRDQEKEESSRFMGGGEYLPGVIGAGITKEQSSVSTSYRIKTRQISNCMINKTTLTLENLSDFSPKLKKLYDNTQLFKKQLGIIYSSFLTSGLEFFAKILELHNYTKYDINNNDASNEYKTYAYYTGAQTLEEKDRILQIYNSKENIDGKIIQLLLISSAGSEGLDLKNVRHVHIMEPYWNYARIHQVESRAIRYKSHDDLPKKDKTVKVYIYLSTYHPEYLEEQKSKLKATVEQNKLTLKQKDLDVEKPTDVHLFGNSIKAKELNDKILQTLAEISIECQIFNKKINFSCFNCKPTNEKLYHKDFQIDLELPSKCQQEQKISTEEVIFNGKKYYYDIENPANIYYFDKQVNGYILLEDNIIIEKIIKKNNI
jgi:hypothetical protein